MDMRTKIPIFFILLSFSLTIVMAQDNNAQFNNLNVKYIGYDDNNNSYKLNADLSLIVKEEGNIKYIEEYYSLINNYPSFLFSRTHYDNTISKNDFTKESYYNFSFNIYRPSGKYSLIKGIVLFDGKRIFEQWITKNKNFIDNTDSTDDKLIETQERAENIEKFEVRENSILSNSVTSFKYSTLDIISKIDVIGTSNYDSVSLKVSLFRDVPSTVYKLNPSVRSYKYFEIKSDNSRIKEIIPEFKIEKSWIENNNITSIIAVKWNEDTKEWNPLITKYVDNDSSYIYFNFTSPFSETDVTFAIVGFNPQQTSSQHNITEPIVTPQVTVQLENSSVQEIDKPTKIVSNFEATLIAIVLILLIYTFKIRK